MRIGVIGTGYVGLVTATCLADSGNDVVAVDNDAQKIAALRGGDVPIFEPGLRDLLNDNAAAGRLRFTTDLAEGVCDREVIFLAIGTPPAADGAADTSALQFVAGQIGRLLAAPAIVVIKSTAPVGTGAQLEEIIRDAGPHRCPVVCNPEFLKEGDAVNDFLRPDRVVIGADDAAAGDVVAALSEPFVRNNRPILRLSRAAAELTKYAANAYLAMRISFINEIAEYCEHCGVDVAEIRRGIGTDGRIGQHFLYPGLGYGGSCFPKDVQALIDAAEERGASCGLLRAVHDRNLRQRSQLIEKIFARLGKSLSGKTLGVWGLSFKPKTDDLREAPALDVIRALLERGARVHAYDPRAMPAAKREFREFVQFCDGAYEVLDNADALVICTEWNEFRSPDFARMRTEMATPIVFDGRNLYSPAEMAAQGFEYHSIGRPAAYPRSRT